MIMGIQSAQVSVPLLALDGLCGATEYRLSKRIEFCMSRAAHLAEEFLLDLPETACADCQALTELQGCMTVLDHVHC